MASASGMSSAAGKVPQASAMKRSDPHHPQQPRHRDGSDSSGSAAEALVSPDGTVTEAPRTVKKRVAGNLKQLQTCITPNPRSKATDPGGTWNSQLASASSAWDVLLERI